MLRSASRSDRRPFPRCSFAVSVSPIWRAIESHAGRRRLPYPLGVAVHTLRALNHCATFRKSSGFVRRFTAPLAHTISRHCVAIAVALSIAGCVRVSNLKDRAATIPTMCTMLIDAPATGGVTNWQTVTNFYDDTATDVTAGSRQQHFASVCCRRYSDGT